ncbi:hypothetical protein NPIL_424741 [Nephila pilipes]|uniref:Uncharacterized protein n=1 Tax=Nephila pilipes TaxID=299642 RepID=A0A8X6QG82_NEPPI|nr:hypothetical protein NPIL_424741 [Nephila pilipes]
MIRAYDLYGMENFCIKNYERLFRNWDSNASQSKRWGENSRAIYRYRLLFLSRGKESGSRNIDLKRIDRRTCWPPTPVAILYFRPATAFYSSPNIDFLILA